MFSGKSTELIRRVRRFQAIGKKVVVLNHLIDDRYSNDSDNEEQVKTHYGDGVRAVKLSKLGNFISRYAVSDARVDVVCIDEAQFFGDLYEAVVVMVEEYGIHVVVAGLSGDYRRHNFGEIYRLFPLADAIVKLDALCGICNDGKKAPFTKRISGSGDQVEVGSSDKYIAVCRLCYLK